MAPQTSLIPFGIYILIQPGCCLCFMVDSNLLVLSNFIHWRHRVCWNLYAATSGGSEKVQWLFTAAFWVILALLNPILFCARGALPPPGMWKWRWRHADCRTKEQSNFSSLLPMTYPKWQSAVHGDTKRWAKGRKSEKYAARMDWEDYISTSFLSSAVQRSNFLCWKQCNPPDLCSSWKIKLIKISAAAP